ncbi:type IV pili methyl-accepting chemotaxis transducer N-terminal domain-containing protein [Undibacterium sp. Rencai35W]|uniref:type IV pili methyl-accepting chemotaxis transducer N-terminal domain-containing protein n=1 Tax=Undibacterium sp. Rencai35W TaxID=3413046 RepID=UPI003BF31CA5
MMNRRSFIGKTVLISSGLGLFSYSVAQVLNINEAINKSGRQRMLSQRLAKAYLQLGQGIAVEQSRKILDNSMTLFDRQLAELRIFAPTVDNKQVLSEMEKSWLSYKQVLAGKTPNQQDARNIMVINEDVLAMAQKATLQLEKYSGSSAGQLVNVAGRQRMLSQRMAKFYQALQWDVAPLDASAKLDTSRKEFIAGMQTLMAAPGNSGKMKEELALAQQQWMFFDSALRQSGESGNRLLSANNVASTSERILEVMDGITSMYQQLS